RREDSGQGLARGGGGGQHHVGPGVGELSGLLLVDPGSGDPGFGQMFDQSRIAPGGEGALPARAGGAALDVGQASPAGQRLGEVGQQLLRMACTHPAHSLRRRADTSLRGAPAQLVHNRSHVFRRPSDATARPTRPGRCAARRSGRSGLHGHRDPGAARGGGGGRAPPRGSRPRAPRPHLPPRARRGTDVPVHPRRRPAAHPRAGGPAAPAGRGGPGTPGSPDDPGAPGSPDDPGAPGGPDDPGAPGGPDAPGGEVADPLLRATIDLSPYEATDDAGEISWWIASDRSELATGTALGPEHVLGVGGASLTLARITPRTRVGRVLDVGCGGGIQALHASRHADHVVATDLSERALAFAEFNAALNGIEIELRQGSLLEPVRGESFDLIVSNPPFVITPRSSDEQGAWVYRDGGRAGDALLGELLEQLPQHLLPGGRIVMLGNWEISAADDADGDWDAHPRRWLEPA